MAARIAAARAPRCPTHSPPRDGSARPGWRVRASVCDNLKVGAPPMEQQQQHPSWEHLMAAAEGVAGRFVYAGPSPQRVDGDIVELMERCPGFKEHEYRQAYWQGVQNLKSRTEHTFSIDASLADLPPRADNSVFDPVGH